MCAWLWGGVLGNRMQEEAMTWPEAIEKIVEVICLSAVVISIFGDWPWRKR